MIRELYEGAHEAKLGSGLRILVEEVPQSRSVSVGLWVRVGSRDDSPDAAGIAHFIEHLAFKGTKTRDAARISREIDAVGGNLNAATGRESTVYYVDAPADGLTTALDLLADLTTHPAFTPESLELERTVVLDEIRGHNEDPESFAFDRFIESVWGDDNALSRTILGTPLSVERISRDDVMTHHRRHYRPSEMVVVAAGAVVVEPFVEAVAAHLGTEDSVSPFQGLPRTRPSFHQVGRRLVRDGGQSHLHFALPGPPAFDRDRYVLDVINTAYGDGTSSRLFRAIREDRGLAYAVGSTLIRYTDAGLWLAYASSSPVHVQRVQALVVSELEHLAARGLDEEEFNLAKARLRGLFVLGLESNGHRAMRLGTAAMSNREILSPEEVLSRLDAVTADDVNTAIERFVRPDNLHITTVGPYT